MRDVCVVVMGVASREIIDFIFGGGVSSGCDSVVGGVGGDGGRWVRC